MHKISDRMVTTAFVVILMSYRIVGRHVSLVMHLWRRHRETEKGKGAICYEGGCCAVCGLCTCIIMWGKIGYTGGLYNFRPTKLS